MATQYLSLDTLRFMLYDVHDLSQLLGYERFKDYDPTSVNILLDAVKTFADKECYPCFREMDEQPVRFENGQVLVHPQVQAIMAQAGALGLIGSSLDYAQGGLQLPSMVYQAAYFIMDAANNHVSGYPGLTAGAAGLIVSFGSEALKQQYVPRMLAGEWAGTMCLTEPQAGSSLADITTTATPTDDGYYQLKGQKIWISGGDQQFSENIVHLVLARLAGAPAGTKGISLFVVPKKRPTADGGLEPNDVVTAGDFQKLGQRGYSTVHLVFGDHQDCHAWLVGAPHQGLAYMFQMMNGARISVGRHGVAIATAAYYASLQYARERPQGRRLPNGQPKDLTQGQTPIVNHPDVRRMLLFQKAIAEGTLSLILQASRYHDLEQVADSEAERQRAHLLLELLTPIVKTYPAEMAQAAASAGIQVLGGMGYSREHVLQQYYRDARIMAIYEGTTGIQGQDLLGRKVGLANGQALKLLLEEINQTIAQARTHEALRPYAARLADRLPLNQEILDHLAPHAQAGNHERYLADATAYLEFLGIIVVAWQWLKIATVAQEQLVAGNSTWSVDFLESKVHTMKFYFKYEIPKTEALALVLTSPDVLTIAREQELIF